MNNPFLQTDYNVSLIVRNYPCRVKEDTNEPVCRIVSFEELERLRARIQWPKDPEICPENKELKKRKFDPSRIYWLPYTRQWDSNEILFGKHKLWPKTLKQPRKIRDLWKKKCPRELDAYEKKLWIPICDRRKPPPLICPEPVDKTKCIFCLGSLYTGGYIYDLSEKIPFVKKQSEEYKDEIKWRIGIDTNLTVHKRCYLDYINRLEHVKESPDEKEDSLNSSDLCGEKKPSVEEVIKDISPIKPHFCLKKPAPPLAASGKFIQGISNKTE